MRRNGVWKRILAGGAAAAFSVSLTACSSSMGTHISSYTGNVKKIVSAMSSSGGSSASGKTETTAAESTGKKLDTPTEFSIDAEGNYTFRGVDGANFYLLYLCSPEATGDGDDYLFASNPIYEDGSGTYTGRCSDLFRYAYGEYLAKVYALPELTDTEYSMSGAAHSDYRYSGEQDAPVLDYFWDTNNGKLELVLTNAETYQYQAYPDKVDVTFVNTEDETDQETVSLTEITEDNTSIWASGLKKGAAYRVTAVSESGSEFVTNPVSESTVVAEELRLGDTNLMSENYTYSDGWATFPRLMENCSLDGGVMGTMTGKFGSITVDIEAEKTAANPGSAYSYTLKMDFGGFVMDGGLELKTDGSAEMAENGAGPVAAGSITGSWTDNGDGTATISLVPAEISS